MSKLLIERPFRLWLANTLFVPPIAAVVLAWPVLVLLAMVGWIYILVGRGIFSLSMLMAFVWFLVMSYSIGAAVMVIQVTLLLEWQRRWPVGLLAVGCCGAAALSIALLCIYAGDVMFEGRTTRGIGPMTTWLLASLCCWVGLVVVWFVAIRVKIVSKA